MKSVLTIILFLLYIPNAFATITVIQQSGQDMQCTGGDSSSTNSVTVNTAGGNFIGVGVGYVNNGTDTPIAVSDGTNTYTILTVSPGTPSYGASVIAYAKNVSSGTYNVSANPGAAGTIPSICVIVLAGVDTSSPLDKQDGNTTQSSTTTIHPVSIPPFTPSQNSEVILTIETGASATADSIDSGFATPAFIALVGGVNYSQSMSYKIQTSAATVDPIWTVAVATTIRSSSIASFKVLGAAPSVVHSLTLGMIQ